MIAPRPIALAVTLAVAIDLLGVILLAAAGPRSAAARALAFAIHLAAAAPLACAPALPASRRALLVAFALALPLVGAPIATIALRGGARCELLDPVADVVWRRAAPDLSAIRRVADALPAPEALLAADLEDRRAMLSALGRRADAGAIALLRWALTAASTDLGMEAALALEDMSARFEKRLRAFREELAAAPTRATAMAAADLIMRGIEASMFHATLVDGLADEARRYYVLAQELDPQAGGEAALGRACLELSVLRPDAAIDALDRALAAAPGGLREKLEALRQEALLRTHNVPWEGPSLLATYRPAPPPLLVTRGRKKAAG